MVAHERRSDGLLPHPAVWQRIGELEEAARSSNAAGAETESAEPLSALYARATTDGELLDDGVPTLVDALQLCDTSVFADLGSGFGGAVLRVAAAIPMRGCFGVELVGSKHAAAMTLLESLGESLVTPVKLWQGDLIEIEQRASDPPAEEDAPQLGELTHAFSCSVCFDDFLLRRVAQALGNREAFPHFQALLTLRELPSQPYLVKVGTVRLCCTWNAEAKSHVYVPADVLEQPVEERPVAVLQRHLCTDEGVCTLPASLQWPKGSWMGRLAT